MAETGLPEAGQDGGQPKVRLPRRRRSAVTLRISPTVLALVTVFVSAIGPTTVALQSCSQLKLEQSKAESQLKLESVKEKRDLRPRYLELAVSRLTEPAVARAEILRFLAYNFEDPDLAAWAREAMLLARNEPDSLKLQRQTAKRCERNCKRAFAETQGKIDSTNRQDVVDCSELCVEEAVDAAFMAKRARQTRDPLGERCLDSCQRSALESQGKTADEVRRDLTNCAKVCVHAAYLAGAESSKAASSTGGAPDAP